MSHKIDIAPFFLLQHQTTFLKIYQKLCILLTSGTSLLNWWKGKPSGSIACTWKQQPRFYWSCSSIVMNDATPLTPPSAWAELHITKVFYFEMNVALFERENTSRKPYCNTCKLYLTESVTITKIKTDVVYREIRWQMSMCCVSCLTRYFSCRIISSCHLMWWY